MGEDGCVWRRGGGEERGERGVDEVEEVGGGGGESRRRDGGALALGKSGKGAVGGRLVLGLWEGGRGPELAESVLLEGQPI